MTAICPACLMRIVNRLIVQCIEAFNNPPFIRLPCTRHRLRHKLCYFFLFFLSGSLLLYSSVPLANATEVSEYRLKAAFLYNFIAYTRWPDQTIDSLTVCIHAGNPFGENLQYLKNKKVNDADILIQYTKHVSEFSDCQAIFISGSAMGNLDNILNRIKNKPILTISDSINAGRQGVMINMTVKADKINFDVNLNAAQNADLEISAQLLRLAKEVFR